MDLAELSKKENVDPKKLEVELELGRAVVLTHKKNPIVISRLCSTKVNTNLGISSNSDVEEEIEKLKIAEYHKTDSVMDLSTKNTNETLAEFLKHSNVPVGTVPIYSCYPDPDEDEEW